MPRPLFHEDRKINVASREKCPAPGGHVFQPKGIIFDLIQYIIGINLLSKFHDNWTINVASRVKNAPPLSSHVFQAKVTIFKLIQDIIGINLLTKFHEDQVLTRKNAPLPGGHVFQPTGIIFELFQDINRINLLTKFHEVLDWTINVASRPYKKNAPTLGSHVFQAKVTIFEVIQYRIRKNLLSKFHEDRKINVASRVLTRNKSTALRGVETGDGLGKTKNAPPPGGHVFQLTGIIFDLVQDITGMNLLTKFHEDQTINVASRVKNAPPLGSHDIIETNLLTKFHEDWK
ncbi:hypothetical protein DPMN_177255 [Dreissena polymorpha]|uniref:Uncharacterized protein n=1 Tax=Dreissena polymorpha TaxID=45954 RepID=A0A9D4E9X1_DREPO|nr:hypothetical protein DPMN_177255 [Dreissena polymorpha]